MPQIQSPLSFFPPFCHMAKPILIRHTVVLRGGVVLAFPAVDNFWLFRCRQHHIADNAFCFVWYVAHVVDFAQFVPDVHLFILPVRFWQGLLVVPHAILVNDLIWFSFIACLLNPCSPSTVIRFISTVIINPVNG